MKGMGNNWGDNKGLGDFYYDSPGLGRKRMSYRRKILIQLGVCLIIVAVALAVTGSKNSWGQKVEGYLKYLMTKEVNYKPVFQKVVDLGLRSKNFDWPSIDDSYNSPVVTVVSNNQRELMSLPISGKTIRQFGWIKSEIDSAPRFHEGIDISAPEGKPVKAALDGVVTKVGNDKVLGKYIIIDHGKSLKTLYAQLSTIDVKAKEKVREGQSIGQVGQTGVAKTPHLHFEVREGDKLVNPIDKLK